MTRWIECKGAVLFFREQLVLFSTMPVTETLTVSQYRRTGGARHDAIVLGLTNYNFLRTPPNHHGVARKSPTQTEFPTHQP